MKTIIRLVIGLVSSLLLSAGLCRAASHLDALPADRVDTFSDANITAPSAACTRPCYFAPRESLNPGARHV